MKNSTENVVIILEKREGSSLPDLIKNKFVTPKDLFLEHLKYIICRRNKLSEDNFQLFTADGLF